MCPLCNGVLDMDKDFQPSKDQADLESYESRSLMYPDVAPTMRRIKFILKLFVFISIIVEAILILINYLTYNGLKWSLICGAAMVYMCFTLNYSFKHNKSHRNKMIVQAIGAMILAVLIDVVLGYTGWSVDYAIPSAIMLLDGAILVLMFVNFSDWQNYIIVQFGMLVISIVFFILTFVGVVKHPLLTIIAFGVSVLLLLGTLLFGDKKAINEVTRRFRV